jgi:hypothetical protein
VGLDDVERRKILPLPRLEFRPLGRPARSQSLCRLRYLGASVNSYTVRRHTPQDSALYSNCRSFINDSTARCWALASSSVS